jgi:hypothetical protein
LRPDSLLAVVLISDENDCSIREKEQGFYAARTDSMDLPRGTAACAANPNDPCCVSCISPLPAGCKADPSCEANGGELPDELDAPNLRCFDQKRRFGIDFLYPTSRYVNALRQVRLCLSRDDLSTAPGDECPDDDGDGAPDVARNPIYSDLSATGTMIRDRSIVFIAGIVGVPWQDIAARTAADPVRRDELHYMTASELRAAGVWAKILGEPSPGGGAPPVPPTNALMIESTSPRTGFDGQGNALAPPDSPPMANPVNGHEWQNLHLDDLMYACIFELPGPRDCKEIDKIKDARPGCDCSDQSVSSLAPICQAESGEYGRKQRYAKAYPAIRELQVLRDFGDNAIVGSICARNVKDPSQQDFGYRPATDAIVDRLREGLTDRCFHRALEPDPVTHTPPCVVIEARPPGESCDAARRRSPASGDALPLVRQRVEDRGLCDAPGRPACSALVLCEVAEAGPACHRQMEQPDVGWCYVDPAQNPEDDPEIVASCPPAQKRLVRFVDPVPVVEPNVHALVVCPAQR